MDKNLKLLSEIYKFFHKQLNKEPLYGKEVATIQMYFEQLEKNLKELEKMLKKLEKKPIKKL